MTANAVIDGSFADLKLVKTRSVCQLVIEIPIERAEEAIQKFGIPLPGQEISVAVARLQTPAEESTPDPDKSSAAQTRYRTLPPMKQAAQRSAMLCTDKQFHMWLVRKFGINFPMGHDHAVIATNWMRRYLGAESRSEIGMDDEVYRKFLALETDYKQAIGLMAEPRG